MAGIRTSQVKALIKSVRNKSRDGASRFIGISSPFLWLEDESVEVDGETYDIVQCCSELHIREALAAATRKGRSTVVITSLDDPDLGEDLRLRFHKRSLRKLNAWDNVMAIHEAYRVDPRVRKHRWIAEELLEASSSGETPPAPNGMMSADFVWGILLDSLIGLKQGAPDTVELLEWAHRDESRLRLRELDGEQYLAVRDWLTLPAGPLAGPILHALREADTSPLVLGLICEVIYSCENRGNSKLGKAEIRLENFSDWQNLDRGLAQKWGAAAVGVVEKLTKARETDTVAAVFGQVDDVMANMEIEAHADRSTVLPAGFERRLVNVSNTLLTWIDEPEMPPELPDRLALLRQHRQAQLEAHRVDRAEMATRLVRYLHRAEHDTYDAFLNGVESYRDSGGYVDWARTVLYHGEGNNKVGQVYGRILEAVAAARHQQNRSFAEHLAQLTKQDAAAPSGVIFVEDIVDRVIAKVGVPVVVVVLDGMSHAVFYELMDSFGAGWSLYDDDNGRFSLTGVATIPSRTSVSRGSLLSGHLTETRGAGEKKSFSSALKVAGQEMPAVFHKADLTTSGGAALSKPVMDAMVSDARIVCAVVNAIDDDLDKGDQVVKQWNLQTLSLLDMILAAASDSGRCVLLASDHGHVLDRGSNMLDGGEDAGERNRLPNGPLNDGEVLVEGRRVLRGEGRLVVPWDEGIRYRKKKNGYHGGITPQEMLVPLALLAREPKAGWGDRVLTKPSWWEAEGQAVKATVTHSKKSTPKDLKPLANLPLFVQSPKAVESEEVVSLPWVEALLKNSLYLSQKKTYSRMAPADEKVALFLEVLSARGGKCLRPALAESLKMPMFRVQGFISAVQRLLNVDGYFSISFDAISETVSLNMEILTTQFGLDANEQ
ncbi:MAG: BREX-2 system phosphatase PglZ [Lentisphaerae bacterium]|nr:BREX-2 system phosphatase PglZ [Lentisphaerota bacterium]